jgi:hypothetical protein
MQSAPRGAAVCGGNGSEADHGGQPFRSVKCSS